MLPSLDGPSVSTGTLSLIGFGAARGGSTRMEQVSESSPGSGELAVRFQFATSHLRLAQGLS